MAEIQPFDFGNYRVEAEIGWGGFGTVFRAIDSRLERAVALKVMDPYFIKDAEWVSRFYREARLMARMDHPHIVPIYEADEHDGRLYLAMKLIEGPDLSEYLSHQAPLSWSQALDIMTQIAGALDYAHENDVIHRDLKPANVLLSGDQVLLTDFGLARLVGRHSLSATMSGGIIGTPAYLAPEVWEGEPDSPAVDIYALACIFSEMLTGEMLFAGDTTPAVMRAHFRPPQLPEAWPADVPPGLNDVLLTALSQDPAQRHGGAGEFVASLGALASPLREESQPSPPAHTTPPQVEPQVEQPETTTTAGVTPAASRPEEGQATKPARRRTGLIAGCVVVVLLASAAILYGLYQLLVPPEGLPAAVAALLGRDGGDGLSLTREIDSEAMAEPTEVVESSPADPGTYAGIGAYVYASEDGEEIVLVPMPDTPAEIAGLLPDDVLLAVDGVEMTPEIDVSDVVEMIKGETGTSVVLTVLHPGEDRPVDIEVERGDIPIPPTATPTPAPPLGKGTFLERAMAGEFAGGTVGLMGGYSETDAEKMFDVLDSFLAATGIEVELVYSTDFQLQIESLVEAGDPPDIAALPDLGMLRRFAAEGQVVDVSGFLPGAHLRQTYNQSWLDMATVESPAGPIMGGVWHRAWPFSLVWYPRARFEEWGYQVPETWDELLMLTDLMAGNEGEAPWCIGMESGDSTGWVATNWVENILLRTAPLEDYDRWTAGELPFASSQAMDAVERMSEIWLNDAFVYGGTSAIVSTSFYNAPLPMFSNPPGCWLHFQGPFIDDFIVDAFPELEPGVDYDFFVLPPIDPAYGNPLTVYGDIMVMFNDSPEARALMEYFSTGASVEPWARRGGAVFPHLDSDPEWYADYVDRKLAQILLDADSVRYDASDLMPTEVGFGSFWTMMTEYVSGNVDLDTALEEIDASWP